MEFDETSFPVQVYTVVASIPEGKVTTYGSIARLAGFMAMPATSEHY